MVCQKFHLIDAALVHSPSFCMVTHHIRLHRRVETRIVLFWCYTFFRWMDALHVIIWGKNEKIDESLKYLGYKYQKNSLRRIVFCTVYLDELSAWHWCLDTAHCSNAPDVSWVWRRQVFMNRGTSSWTYACSQMRSRILPLLPDWLTLKNLAAALKSRTADVGFSTDSLITSSSAATTPSNCGAAIGPTSSSGACAWSSPIPSTSGTSATPTTSCSSDKLQKYDTSDKLPKYDNSLFMWCNCHDCQCLPIFSNNTLRNGVTIILIRVIWNTKFHKFRCWSTKLTNQNWTIRPIPSQHMPWIYKPSSSLNNVGSACSRQFPLLWFHKVKFILYIH